MGLSSHNMRKQLAIVAEGLVYFITDNCRLSSFPYRYADQINFSFGFNDITTVASIGGTFVIGHVIASRGNCVTYGKRRKKVWQPIYTPSMHSFPAFSVIISHNL